MPKVTRFCAPQSGDAIAHPKHNPGGPRHGATRRFFALQFVAVLTCAATMACARQSSAATLSADDFAYLARDCAPSISPAILRAVARTESGLDPFALHDDTTGKKDNPISQMQAQAEASRWMRHGDSVDIGLMQINSANFSVFGSSSIARQNAMIELLAEDTPPANSRVTPEPARPDRKKGAAATQRKIQWSADISALNTVTPPPAIGASPRTMP